MAVEQLTFLGINRAISDYVPSTACEELINLRTTGTGLVPVKPFKVQMSNKAFSKVFEHYAQGSKNYIGLEKGDGFVYIYRLQADGTKIGSAIGSISAPTGVTVDDIVNNIHFATAGNIILFSVSDKTHSFYLNRSYIWKNGAYARMEADAPTISYGFSGTTFEHVHSELITGITDGSDAYTIDGINSAINEIQEKNPDLCFGPIIVAIAFKTNDRKTFWTGNWGIYDPIPSVKSYTFSSLIWTGNYKYYVKSTDIAFASLYTDYFTKYPDGGFLFAKFSPNGYVNLIGAKIKMTIAQLASGQWNKDTSTLQSIEIYTSRPQIYLDADLLADYTRTQEESGQIDTWSILPPKSFSEMNLDGQLMYHQASIPLAELNSASQEITLTFGGSIQLTNDTLEVDSGMMKRYGKIFSYNARFHFYDSISQTEMVMPSLYGGLATTISANIFIRYDNRKENSLLYLGIKTVALGYSDIVIAPSINVKEVIVNFYSGGYWYAYQYTMKASSSYNYSINAGGQRRARTRQSAQYSDLQAAIDANPNGAEYFYENETDAINVTEQYNPFVFLVEHSYLMPGNVLDVQTQMAATPNVEYGSAPLNVFTDRGTYALLQGSANVLYSAVDPRPVNNLTSIANSISTEKGTFFLADGALWLQAGIDAVLVSEALSLGPHKEIRDCIEYGRISHSSQDTYDVQNYESSVPFDIFVNGGTYGTTTVSTKARLAYNRHRDELIVANPSLQYSYVLSLKHRQWHKITKYIYQDVPGSTIANTPNSSNLDILDLSSEVAPTNNDILVHLQSRPFSFGYQYSHIHRIVAMLRASLAGYNDLTVALYGTDDLRNWTLLSFAYKYGSSTPLHLSQIRTPSAARSWRYYTICIGGHAPADTDMGPVLVDYQGVIRRIG